MARVDDELIQVVVQEVSDRLNALDGLLLDIEEDPSQRDLLDQFMRAAHTLKGTAGIGGLATMSDLAHSIEAVVERLRDGHLRASPEMFDRLSQALEVIGRSLGVVAAGQGEPPEIAAAGQALEQWLEQLGARSADPDQTTAHAGGFVLGEYDVLRIGVLQKKGHSFCRVHVPLPVDAGDPATWATSVLRTLTSHGTVVATDPPSAELTRLVEQRRLSVLLATELGPSEVVDYLEAAGIAGGRVEEHAVPQGPVRASAGGKIPQKLVSERTVRVDLSVLDELLRLVGELMISRDRYRQVAGQFGEQLDDAPLGAEIADSAAQLGHLSSELQDAIMRARMVPVSRVFRRIKREVRAVARAADRPLPFETMGEATELDKNLVDLLSEPLARFAHGVAQAQHESATATDPGLRVTAERRWNQVMITVYSRSVGVSDGTAEELSRVLASCGGRLDQRAHRDGSATYTVALPLTLAIIQAIMARVGDEVYAFPIEVVQETVRLEPDEVTQIKGARVSDLRGRPLSLLYLREFFQVPGAASVSEQRVLVLGSDARPVGVAVDEIIGIREVVIKPLSSRLSHISAISGSAILGDDQIALILNAEALVADAVRQAETAAAQPRPRPVPTNLGVSP